MSCNGCRVLRKGCSESCILRPCLQWIHTPQAQAHATLFVAKFFGRACLMSFISNVPQLQRPALFQSLLFEACGRTVNPVNGAVGLLWTRNWHLCQAAVETVLRDGFLSPVPEFYEGEGTCTDMWRLGDPNLNSCFTSSRSKGSSGGKRQRSEEIGDLNLRLSPNFLQNSQSYSFRRDIRRPGSPSIYSEESVTTTACLDSGLLNGYADGGDIKVLNLFV